MDAIQMSADAPSLPAHSLPAHSFPDHSLPDSRRAPDHVARLVNSGTPQWLPAVTFYDPLADQPFERPEPAFDPKACVGGLLFFSILGGSAYLTLWAIAKAVEFAARW